MIKGPLGSLGYSEKKNVRKVLNIVQLASGEARVVEWDII